MCIPTRWMQWLFRFLSRHEDDAEEDGADQQQDRLGTALGHLQQRTMDPLIAAQVYNNQHSPLYQLPDETLLLILHFLSDNPVALYCLQRVGRRFRRLIDEPSVWTYGEHPLTPLERSSGRVPKSCWRIWNETKKLQRHLRTDGMCDECKLWCDVPVQGWSRRLTQMLNPFPSVHYPDLPPTCKFEPFYTYGPRLHCRGCNVHHIKGAFAWIPGADWQQGSERQCVAHLGRVKLCDHVGITWRTVEKHIAIWEKYKPGEWQACLDNFKVECRHPSHDTGCSSSGAPTWPRARLRGDENWYHRVMVVLVLDWNAHSGDTDAFTWTSTGRPFASDMRTLFQKYRQQGPADALVPMHSLGPLPEMVCFDPNKCRCLHYHTGDSREDLEAPGAADGARQHARLFLRDDCPAHRNRPSGSYRRINPALRWNSERTIRMSQHWPRGTLAAPCLVTTYRCTVEICDKGMWACTNSFRTHPTHGWFHALDPDTFPRPPGHSLPLCKDRGCMNYYKRPKAFGCMHEPFDMFAACDCDKAAGRKKEVKLPVLR